MSLLADCVLKSSNNKTCGFSRDSIVLYARFMTARLKQVRNLQVTLRLMFDSFVFEKKAIPLFEAL